MKALTITNHKIWPMLKFLLTKKQTNGQAKNYMYMPLHQSMRGHKNTVNMALIVQKTCFHSAFKSLFHFSVVRPQDPDTELTFYPTILSLQDPEEKGLLKIL